MISDHGIISEYAIQKLAFEKAQDIIKDLEARVAELESSRNELRRHTKVMRRKIKEVNAWITELSESRSKRDYYQSKPIRLGEQIICIERELLRDEASIKEANADE